MQIKKIWKDIKEFEGKYQVSNLGDVKSLYFNNSKKINPKILKLSNHRLGYSFIELRKDKKRYTFFVHRLVAINFLSNPLKLECVNHKNGIKHDNRVENLEWCTKSHNTLYAYKIGLHPRLVGELNKCNKVTSKQVRRMRHLHSIGVTQTEIGKIFGLSQAHVSKIVKNQCWNI